MNVADFPRIGLPESIEELGAMPAFLDAAIDATPPDDLGSRPGPEEFSLLEHACHLRDLEREGYLVRARRALTEACPALEPFDGAKVAAARDYLSQDARIAAREFAAARRELVGLLTPLTVDDMRREARFGDQPVCLGDLVAMMVEHDRGHRGEIERLVDELEE
ncbi:MAG: DinB family protein [Usitatibacter sp.]